MPNDWTDPGSLEGDTLAQWYQRSPADLERERQEAVARRYRSFFYGNADTDPDPRFSRQMPAGSRDIDPGFAMSPPAPSQDPDPGFTWATAGPNRSQSVGIATDGKSINPTSSAPSIDDGSAPADGALRANVIYHSPASVAPLYGVTRQDRGAQIAPASQQAPIDSSQTPVFRTGPDGRLHPIPGWHTTGPFDFGAWSHNIHWGGVARDLGEIGVGAVGAFSGIGLGGELLSALGPEAETAVAEGIAESPAAKAASEVTHAHHPNPKYMGGAVDQERVSLVDELHRRFHSVLGKAHREAGFPPVGGKSGSTVKWGEHFDRYPGSRDKAMEILQRVSREFDETYGTNISPKLRPTPTAGGVGPPPPD